MYLGPPHPRTSDKSLLTEEPTVPDLPERVPDETPNNTIQKQRHSTPDLLPSVRNEPVYGNLDKDTPVSKPIKIVDLEEYVRNRASTGDFEKEYQVSKNKNAGHFLSCIQSYFDIRKG